MEPSLHSEGKAPEGTETSEADGKQEGSQSSPNESHEDMVVKLEVVDSETSSDQTVLQLRASANVSSAPFGGKFIIMDEFEDELLIAEVKRSPILYDKNHLNFKNLRRKKEVWEDVGEQIGMDGEIAKKRWINIRDAFQAYLNRVLAASRSDDPPKTIKTYKYAHLLGFLLAHMKKGRSFENAMQAVEPSTDGSGTLKILPSCTEMPDVSVSADERKSSVKGKKYRRFERPSKSSIRHIKRKRQLEDTVARHRVKYRQIQRALVSTRDDDDGTENFFKAMAAAVGRLPNRAKAEVKLQIHQLVQQAELKYLYPVNDPQVSQGPSGSRSEEDSTEIASQTKERNVEGTDSWEVLNLIRQVEGK